MEDRYCSKCGTAYVGQSGVWPRKCHDCDAIRYSNPVPVVVMLIPVMNDEGVRGVLICHRKDKKQWALPGGCIESKDKDWRIAAAREIDEETGFIIKPAFVKCFDIQSSPVSDCVILYGHYDLLVKHEDLPKPLGNGPPKLNEDDEIGEIRVAYKPEELAFPLHTAMLKRYFRSSGTFKSPSGLTLTS